MSPQLRKTIFATAPTCGYSGKNHLAGLTLFELMAALTVAAVMLSAAAGSLRHIVLDARLRTQANELRQLFLTARRHASEQVHPVIVCPAAELPVSDSADTTTCSGSWSDGAVALTTSESTNKIGQTLLSMHGRSQTQVVSNRRSFTVRPLLRSTNGTLLICDHRGNDKAIGLVIGYSGEPRLVSAADASLRCS